MRQRFAGTLYIAPGHPWENAHEESFHGRFRDECLNQEVFRTVAEARVVTEDWRRHDNESRPHSKLGYRTPVQFRNAWIAEHPGRAKAAGTDLAHEGPPDPG